MNTGVCTVHGVARRNDSLKIAKNLDYDAQTRGSLPQSPLLLIVLPNFF